MNDYSQPDFYRFNQDSLLLVKWILDYHIGGQHLLDLGAGSGIIGIELSRSLKPSSLTLVELQADYLPHLELNLKHFLPSSTKPEVLLQAFSQTHLSQKFDLIVANPPYYLPGNGQLAENLKRARARSFLQDDWKVLLQVVQEHLSEEGKAFMVIKNDPQLLHEVASQQVKLNIHFHALGDVQILELSHFE
jgi:tRNA1Val (adenine37-N6)-methyltransferase